MLSIVIPTLNAADTLARVLKACASANAEIILCDGGSTDKTCEIARNMGARVITSEPGRGIQLGNGAKAASANNGDWLLFLHADSIPAKGWEAHVNEFIHTRANRFHAGVFRMKLDDPAKQARRIEWWARLRMKTLALPYGDQGLLISRAWYDGLGGYRPLPLMEDVDIIRRIGRNHLRVLPCHVTTSASRYQRDGYWKRPLLNLALLCLFLLGMPPKTLVRMYS